MTTVREVNGGTGAHAHSSGDPFDCPLFRMLPSTLQQESRETPHLWSYLHGIRVDEVGVPEYAEKLDEDHKDLPQPNILYPVGQGIFIHIRCNMADARDDYMTVEPNKMPRLPELITQVDIRLIEFADALRTAEDPEQRAEILLGIVDEICEAGEEGLGRLKRLFNRGNADKLVVTPLELMGIRYIVLRDKMGLGTLQPMIDDPYIEDISCSGVGSLFVEHKIFGGLRSEVSFEDNDQLDRFVIRLSEKIGKPVTFREPIVDAMLPDGSRVNIVFGGDVSKRGSNFTIRKFAATPISVLQLIDYGTMNYEVASYLSFLLREGMNLFVSGETASGKTTLLNALSTFIRPDAKIITIEDTPEVQLPHPNWTREVVRGSTKEDATSTVSMMDLLKAALRQRPNEIIIGEIRGEEGAIAFQAMQAGNAVLATFHASSVEKLIQRLTGNPINIPRTYIDTLNVVVTTSSVTLPNGKLVRRIISINEIVSYDPSTDNFSYVEVFRWSPYTDTYEFVGYQNSYLLEQRIAPKRGISPNNRRRIYGEIAQRAQILKKLHETQYTNFYGFYDVLSKAYREGLLR